MVLYVLAGVGGFFASQLQGANAAGASAALCGMIAALAVYGKRRMRPELTRRMLIWAAMILGFGLLVPNIDNWGHGGGFVVGGLLAWPASAVRVPGSATDRAWRTGAVAAVLVVVGVGVVFMVPSVLRMRQQRDVRIFDREVEDTLKRMGQVSAGIVPVEKLPESFPRDPTGEKVLALRMNGALKKTREAPRGPEALAAQAEAVRAWRAWGNRVVCSHYYSSRSP